MRALRVELRGLSTSFRYPHFVVGHQPTYPVPPPATIYGHVSSALGEYVDPACLRFAYSFRCAGTARDLERLHIVWFPPARARSPIADGYPVNTWAEPNPATRDILLLPELTLYLEASSSGLHDALKRSFRTPRYPVVLGRSQDLAGYVEVSEVLLTRAAQGYVEGTLLPWEFRVRTTAGTLVNMPRFIDPQDRRRVAWGTYLVATGKVSLTTSPAEPGPGTCVLDAKDELWIDPASPPWADQKRAVVWQTFCDEEGSSVGSPPDYAYPQPRRQWAGS